MPTTLTGVLQHLIPPLLLTYFYFAWKICTFEIAPQLVSDNRIHPFFSFNHEDHSDVEPMIERCYKGKCGGRWKPARSRHCSICERCRGGWDHHCPFFANCLSAPYMRSFLALLLYTVPTVFIISSPLYVPIFQRLKAAYLYSKSDQYIRENWWDWTYSWVVAGGPIGRYAGAAILGWRQLDRSDGGGIVRLNIGLMVGFGIILALISAGLAFTTITLLLEGNLTIDKGRSSAHQQALIAIEKLKQQNQPIPAGLIADLARFSDKRHFFVPLPATLQKPGRKGIVIETLDHEKPYDHGWKKNLIIVLGLEWSWLLPWNALKRGMGDEVFIWPIKQGVERRLRKEAERKATLEIVD
ncbi:uncharacterized protein L201_006530 [Kwoniella dendrophila CBS 6074]|uniref:Palmitoyltransferase n=1 Tax=Kwoniella dendrophila CBS 6074 TaxID=1295534 RepID=A0AAX4K398_9TREE